MSKTLFMMVHEIYTQLDKPMYDDLTDYERGIKDTLNLLDVRMSGNNVEDMYDFIMTTIKDNHEFTYGYYYQIDYIDEDGLANYIETFDKDEKDKAIESVNILNRANACINEKHDETKYVLDYYRYKIDSNGNTIDGSDELLNNMIID